LSNDLVTANMESDNISILLNISGQGFNCGDVDGKPGINILDVIFLINYKYKDGRLAPSPLVLGNADGILPINILDVVYLIDNIYKDGPEPFCQ